MIKNAFIIWITIQLMLIGFLTLDIEQEINNGTYICAFNYEDISNLWGAILPLSAFTDSTKTYNYCEKQKEENHDRLNH